MSGPAKRARIRDSATSATAQAKSALSVVNSKLEAKGNSDVLRVSQGLNHSLAVEASGEMKKHGKRRGTAAHKKHQSTLGAGYEGGGRHRRASSLRPRESKVSGEGFVEMQKQRGVEVELRRTHARKLYVFLGTIQIVVRALDTDAVYRMVRI